MSYQFAPYTPPPDESNSNRSSVRYAPVAGSSHSAASTSASAANATSSANPFSGVYQTIESAPPGQIKVNKYETTLPIRADISAAASYLLGCITGVIFLILEQSNDYVRFHAWQSSLVFGTLFFFHFIIIFISTTISWILFLTEIVLIGFLAYRAYLDGPTLERYEVPYFGPLASLWVDTE